MDTKTAKDSSSLLIIITLTVHSVISEDASIYCPDVPNKPEITFIIDNTCYHLIQNSNSPATRDFARSDCRSRNGDLLTIKSKEIQDQILTAVNQRSDSHTVLLGLVKEGNHWKWVDGTAITYSNWTVTSDTQAGNCGRLNVMEGGIWEKVNCGTSDWFQVYICEHNKRTEESSGHHDDDDSGVSFTSSHSVSTIVSSVVSVLVVFLTHRQF